jgi:hypothetical protein
MIGYRKRVQLGIATVALVAASLVGLAVFGGTSAHHTAPPVWIYPGHNENYYQTHPYPPHSCWTPGCPDVPAALVHAHHVAAR